MAKITLARAFIVRKRLINEIQALHRTLYSTKVQRRNEESSLIDGKFFKDLLKELQDKRARLVDLNTAIDRANAESARPILNKIEAEKQNLSLYDAILARVKAFEPISKEFDVYKFNEKTKQLGDTVTYENKLIVSDASSTYEDAVKEWTELYENKVKEVQDLEDKLSEVNASTLIEF